jgi:hypothetical protein
LRDAFRRWKVLVPVACLVALVAVEKLDLTRTDSIAAVACTRELLRARPAAAGIISQYRQTILAEAKGRALPPELLATIIYAHQQELTSFRSFTDCAGSAMGSDLSLGLAQIRISTAIGNDGLEYRTVSAATFKKYRSMLLDPARNIRFQAREMRRLLNRDNRLPGITAEELIHYPAGMALLLSEYRMGRQAARIGAARLSVEAFGDLGHMQEDEVYIFDRDAADVRQIQEGVRKYLDFIYCEKGIFNASVCEARRAGG